MSSGKTVDFRQSKAGAIRSKQTDKYYIIFTFYSLDSAFESQRRYYQTWLATGKNYVSSFEILKYDDAYIELLEDTPCDTYEELKEHQRRIFSAHKPNIVNKKMLGGKTVKSR